MVLMHFTLTTLRKLHVSGYGLSVDDGPKAKWMDDDVKSISLILKKSIAQYRYKGNVTALELSDPLDHHRLVRPLRHRRVM